MIGFVEGVFGTVGLRSREGRSVCTVRRGAGLDPRATDKEGWDELVLDLQERMEYSDFAAEKVALRAFGWSSQSYWQSQGGKTPEVPEVERVRRNLAFLEELFEDNQQETADLVKKFPESLALDVDERCRKNVETLKKQYRMDDKRIKNAIKEQPFILGYELDCFGDCLGKCNQCWARF
ncbi:hypothetical protein NDN08_005873 [Rhodosorus marinus]|uniref:Uncharacterized protein n=1 Tax=Rhodosorus marinus TaxID=101924 RepID=A0AAV8V2W4_9RHOD|nr:hypothetical protein NDN08_005873 [Rhodosorus marinus]